MLPKHINMQSIKKGRPSIDKDKKRKAFSVYLTKDEWEAFTKKHGTINNYVRAAIPKAAINNF